MIAHGSSRLTLLAVLALLLATCTPTTSPTPSPTDPPPTATPSPAPTPQPPTATPTATPTGTPTPAPTATPHPLRTEPGDPEEDALPLALDRHGMPSVVSLSFTTGAPCIGGGNFPTYALWLAYEEQNLAYRYGGYLLYDHETWFVCPTSRQGQSVEIRRRDPGAEVPLFILEEEVFDPGGEFSLYGTLSELTAMTVEEFHATFVQTPPPDCLRVPKRDEGPLPPPGLTPGQEDALIADMLTASNDCALPCWWGIRPGVTPWEEAHQRFLAYGKRASTWETESLGTGHRINLFGRHRPQPYDYVVEYRLYEREGVVQLLGVYGHVPGWPAGSWSQAANFTEEWEDYALHRVLTRWGPPTQVLLHYWSEDVAPFGVALIYEERGVLVEYMGMTREPEVNRRDYGLDPVVICPQHEQITDVNLWLAAPGSPEAARLEELFEEMGGGYLNLLPYRNIPTLEKATGMSVETFYETFRQAGSELCLEATYDLGDWYP